jgi:hypothetical protein
MIKPPSKPPFREGTPFTQWAMINVTDRFTGITPLSGYGRTLPEDKVFTIYLPPAPTEDALGQAVLKTLKKSRFIRPWDDRSNFFEMDRILAADKRWHEDFMTRYGYKTKRAAYKNMVYCRAERREGWILIKPYKRDKPGLWRDLPEDKTVLIPATDDAGIVGAAVKLALSHCE